VLEVHEDFAPAAAEPADGPAPLFEARRGVALIAQAKVAPVRGDLEGGGGVLRVGDAERRIAGTQPLVDIVGEPALVAELEGAA